MNEHSPAEKKLSVCRGVLRGICADREGDGEGGRSGFTILEMLVATAILAVLMVLLLSAISQTSEIWRRSTDKVKAFQGARLAFDAITHNLSQATLNTYLDYDNTTNANRYLRKSELKFLSGTAGDGNLPGTTNTGQAFFFQVPAGSTGDPNYSGMESLLNSCGYFVSFTTNNTLPAHVASANNPFHYRLMQMLAPAEDNTIYDPAAGSTDWFASYVGQARPVADNIIALIVRPQDPGAADGDAPNNQYAYDSTLNWDSDPQPITANQLPPVMQVTMVAIDETSAKRLENGSTPPSTISSALAGKFSTPSQYQKDLGDLTDTLSTNRINYRVFSSAVPIRESKWTK